MRRACILLLVAFLWNEVRWVGQTQASCMKKKKDINNQANVVQWWLILYLLIVFAVALATPTS